MDVVTIVLTVAGTLVVFGLIAFLIFGYEASKPTKLRSENSQIPDSISGVDYGD